ncbi:LmeA family phospholipid-binding protein [Streptomyces fagopyri]|uniref:LmeA family phospholipid-binding protein n=1 Tax=Streptomyces fagopyri TaxID=2662397 RepID=UPI0037F46707
MRRRAVIALTCAAALVALPVGGELLARAELRHRIRTAVASRLPDADLRIGLSSRPALLQLVDRRLPFVEVDSAHARIGRIPDASFHARLEGVRLTGDAEKRAEVASARVTVLIPPSAVAGLAGDSGGLPVTGVRTDPRRDTLTLLIGQGGLGSVTVRPETAGGRVGMTVTSVEIMGRAAPDAMARRIRDAVARRADPADYPLGLRATSARVEEDGIHVRLATDGPTTLNRAG